MTSNDTYNADARFAVRDDLVVEEIDDEYLVLDLRGNEYFGLNPVARLIWEALDGDATFGEVVEQICEAFEVERERAEADAAAFIEDAVSAGLVERVDA